LSPQKGGFPLRGKKGEGKRQTNKVLKIKKAGSPFLKKIQPRKKKGTKEKPEKETRESNTKKNVQLLRPVSERCRRNQCGEKELARERKSRGTKMKVFGVPSFKGRRGEGWGGFVGNGGTLGKRPNDLASQREVKKEGIEVKKKRGEGKLDAEKKEGPFFLVPRAN